MCAAGTRLDGTKIHEDTGSLNALDNQVPVETGQRMARHLSLWLNIYMAVFMCMTAEFSTWANSLSLPQDAGKQIRSPGQLFALTTSIFVCFFVSVDILGDWSKESMAKPRV